MSDDPLSLIRSFSDAEKKLASEIFLAPYVPGGKITVKVKGVVLSASVVDEGPLADTPGFGLFRITESSKAEYVAKPTFAQIEAYLKLMPRVSLTLIEEFDGHWWGVQAQSSDTRFDLKDPVPVRLTERAASFQQIFARFDGSSFWYQCENRRRDPVIARKFRDALDRDVLPDEVRISGATPSELFAYRIIFFSRHPELAPVEPQPEQQVANEIIETSSQDSFSMQGGVHRNQWVNSDLRRLRDALAHAGARLDGYWTNGSSEMTVRYIVDGHTHTANVRLHDLTVVSSGICLSGRDQDFDLTSLVGVMREFHRNEYH
ncbi:hypothetical protein KF728_08870 [Candidatus Obscuribacterales bacterium]|nr:hypothetical protein [Candidatus Obscuribacterales bacterium]